MVTSETTCSKSWRPTAGGESPLTNMRVQGGLLVQRHRARCATIDPSPMTLACALRWARTSTITNFTRTVAGSRRSPNDHRPAREVGKQRRQIVRRALYGIFPQDRGRGSEGTSSASFSRSMDCDLGALPSKVDGCGCAITRERG